MKRLTILLILFFVINSYSQNKTIIDQTKDDKDKIGIDITLANESNLRLEPNVKSSCKILPTGTKVRLLSYSVPFWKVLYLQEIGYISDLFIDSRVVSRQIKEAFINNVSMSTIIDMTKKEKQAQITIEAEKEAKESEEKRQKEIEEEIWKLKTDKMRKIGSPIYFISASVEFNSIGNPEAVVNLYNISKDTIDAYTVGIYCYDRFGKSVNHYAYNTNRFGGLSQETIIPNSENYGEWTLYGHENTAKIKIVLEKVHFTNGKTWYPKKGKSIDIVGVSSL